MSIRRRCTESSCRTGRRCLEHLRFDVMWRGKRFRLPVNEYAIARMESGKQRPIQSMEEARDWERRFIGEIKAGLDPTRPLEQPLLLFAWDPPVPYRFGLLVHANAEAMKGRFLKQRGRLRHPPVHGGPKPFEHAVH